MDGFHLFGDEAGYEGTSIFRSPSFARRFLTHSRFENPRRNQNFLHSFGNRAGVEPIEHVPPDWLRNDNSRIGQLAQMPRDDGPILR